MRWKCEKSSLQLLEKCYYQAAYGNSCGASFILVFLLEIPNELKKSQSEFGVPCHSTTISSEISEGRTRPRGIINNFFRPEKKIEGHERPMTKASCSWNYLGGGNSNIFWCSPWKLGKWSNLTIMFFRWLETTNQLWLNMLLIQHC